MVSGYYILYKIRNGQVDYSKWEYEHRIAYETYHSIKLSSDTVIHHVNHDKLDNSENNLVAYSNKEHSRIHAIERAKTNGWHIWGEQQNRCIDCGAPIYKDATRCIHCMHKSKRTKKHPSKEELAEYIKTMSNVQIAKMCGVSDVSVKKWRKKYGLPSSNEQHGWKRGKVKQSHI